MDGKEMVMEKGSVSIYQALKNINERKYIIPSFQRDFVWNLEKIENLWDSILLGYPISTFLFWHLDEDNVSAKTLFSSFRKNVIFTGKKPDTEKAALSTISIPQTDTAILDGQQRLTSIYLSLLEKDNTPIVGLRRRQNSPVFESELYIELDKNNIKTEEENPYMDSVYEFKFIGVSSQITVTKFRLKDIMGDAFKNEDSREEEIKKWVDRVSADSKDYAEKILRTLYSRIYEENLIHYLEAHNMGQDNAIEMFIRFNSSGKPLTPTEITMSILDCYWQDAKAKMDELLVGPYQDFDKQFIIRSSMMIYGDVKKSCIDFDCAKGLKNNFDQFKNALDNMAKLLRSINIRVEDFIKRWNILVPILYMVINDPVNFMSNATEVKHYLYRGILFKYFQNGTTGKLSLLKTKLGNNNNKFSDSLLEGIDELRVNDQRIEDILRTEKGSYIATQALYGLCSAWLLPMREQNVEFAQDHMHPQTVFVKADGPSGIDAEKFAEWKKLYNTLPNLQLLSTAENSDVKNDRSLSDYFNSKTSEEQKRFREQNFYPDGISLELESFGEFFTARKELLKKELRKLLEY